MEEKYMGLKANNWKVIELFQSLKLFQSVRTLWKSPTASKVAQHQSTHFVFPEESSQHLLAPLETNAALSQQFTPISLNSKIVFIVLKNFISGSPAGSVK